MQHSADYYQSNAGYNPNYGDTQRDTSRMSHNKSTSGYATNQGGMKYNQHNISDIDGIPHGNSFEKNIVTRGSEVTRSLYEKA